MPEATEVSAQISEPMPEFQVAGIQLALQTRLRFWSLVNLEDKAFFQVSIQHIAFANF